MSQIIVFYYKKFLYWNKILVKHYVLPSIAEFHIYKVCWLRCDVWNRAKKRKKTLIFISGMERQHNMKGYKPQKW